MTYRSQPHARTPFARLVHALLLLAWLLSSQGIAPAFVLAAATMDGDHAVKVGAASNGDLTVVLAHDAAPKEEHDALCALIVAFAANTSEEHPDHVLSDFACPDLPRLLIAEAQPDHREDLIAAMPFQQAPAGIRRHRWLCVERC